MHIARLRLYPLKSFDGLDVLQARVLPSGTLEDDRRYALVDREGRFVNAKRMAALHEFRAQFDLAHQTVTLRHDPSGDAITGHLMTERDQLARWLSDRLRLDVALIENATCGFPDDTEAPGPTLISVATLNRVATWFPALSVEEVRRRFRSNIEIDGLNAFAEDRWFGQSGEVVPIRLGDSVTLGGTNPCQRCAVPKRDATTGHSTEDFERIFSAHRQAELPDFTDRSRFNHFYRLAVNTRLIEASASSVVSVGDAVVPLIARTEYSS